MTRTRWLSAAAGALALGMISIPAEAAPLGNATGGLQTTANENALTQDVRWDRRCWRHRGHLHCDRGYRRHRHYYYGNPYRYRDYGYRRHYGPGFSFYFGPRHRHYW